MREKILLNDQSLSALNVTLLFDLSVKNDSRAFLIKASSEDNTRKKSLTSRFACER